MLGVNHGLFASGNMPPEVLKYDFFPDVSIEEAHKTIAYYSVAFMAANSPVGRVNGYRIMDQAFNFTKALIEVCLLKAKPNH